MKLGSNKSMRIVCETVWLWKNPTVSPFALSLRQGFNQSRAVRCTHAETLSTKHLAYNKCDIQRLLIVETRVTVRKVALCKIFLRKLHAPTNTLCHAFVAGKLKVHTT